MSNVFVLDQQRRPLTPAHPGRARYLLRAGHAAIFRRFPFTIILKEVKPDAHNAQFTPLRAKLDPGSKTTGLALVNDATGQIVFAAEIAHHGQQVHDGLLRRRGVRCSRRSRHTRYRPSRFSNRRRSASWLPPSLESRLANILTWVQRLQRLCPLGAISQELVKFDMQLMENAEISGVEHQQGTLAGYEVREYLLEKFHRTCAYCGATNVPLEVEHTIPKSRGGTDRASNLALSCEPCNQAKGNRTAAEFGHPEVQVLARAPLKDAAAVNATRWALYHRLTALGLPVETGSGGRMKWNRMGRDLPKTHWLDAACVGASTPDTLHVREIVPLLITAQGRHSRQMCRTNAAGFPDKAPKATSVVGGFRTGDLVRAVVPAASVKAGVYVGRLAVRATGSCNLKTATGTIQGIHVRFCQPLQRGDGYSYAYGKGGAALPPQASTPGSPRRI
ncbi:MAG TPA: RNA-guided endonuclease IscB [Ktedonobacterales bacterium]|nr:RNA-guided endonuclease IscB [Ktedonobacterales bacterium]